jgi:hypothetical protein
MYTLLVTQIIVKPTDAVQMTVNGLRRKPSVQKVIDIFENFPVACLFNRDLQPDHIMFKGVDIIFNGVERKISSF